MNYYNEFDAKAAAWLRELIRCGHIPAGDVDERSICDVRASDLVGYTQCHFFAGIGGWAEALRLAGWTDDRPVWTGSCPCQPFSCAGKGKGTTDERHLWPEFARLVRQCRPPVVFGEQVEGAVRHGWLDGVFADLEAAGYACGAAVLGAHSVGAPHIRQRLYWVANADSAHLHGWAPERELPVHGDGEGARRMADSIQPRLERHAGHGDDRDQSGRDGAQAPGSVAACCDAGGLGDAEGIGRDARRTEPGRSERTTEAGGWHDARWHLCRDGKHRRVPTEPAFFPLAHGLPARVVRLRGYGNAIVPQVAAEFIRAAVGQ